MPLMPSLSVKLFNVWMYFIISCQFILKITYPQPWVWQWWFHCHFHGPPRWQPPPRYCTDGSCSDWECGRRTHLVLPQTHCSPEWWKIAGIVIQVNVNRFEAAAQTRIFSINTAFSFNAKKQKPNKTKNKWIDPECQETKWGGKTVPLFDYPYTGNSAEESRPELELLEELTIGLCTDLEPPAAGELIVY